jgi:hypothetical protein
MLPPASTLTNVASNARFWTRRLRWRFAGAWQWPAFAVLTFLDGLILHLLPPTSRDIGLVPGIILASFGNLVLVGLAAPWLARRLDERASRDAAHRGGGPAVGRPAPPLEVLLSQAATALLCAGALGLLAAGLGTRPLVVSETEETELNAMLVRDNVRATAPPEVQRNLDTANTLRLATGFFRTCISLDDRTRAWCLYVDTNVHPPRVSRDTNPAPNGRYAEGRSPGG